MARSLSQANRLGALLADALYLPLNRRGYAAASDVSVSAGLGRGGSRSGMVGKLEEKAVGKESFETSSAWAPDPVTGYYRPINQTAEIDPVELREMLLNHKVRSSQ